jgi:anti-sigma factor RsiW
MTCETGRILMETNDSSLTGHVLSCPSCFVGTRACYYEAPSNLEHKIRLRLRRETAAPDYSRWLAIAASVLLIASVTGNVALLRTRVAPRQSIASEVLSAHLRSLTGTHLLDVPSSDQHTVKPWFNGKLDFSPPVKFLDGFPLLGGRIEYFDGRPAAALIYARNKHVINLFIWPADRPQAGAAVAQNGFNMLNWSANGMAFWAVSDLGEAELREFVAVYR